MLLSGLSAGAAISQTLFGGIAGKSFAASRVPMQFTSTRRLRLGNPAFSNTTTEQFIEAAAYHGYRLEAEGTQFGGGGELTVIEMAVNPNSISWRQPKRITKRDTQEGSIFFHFTNSKGQNNDILTMDFRGNTGNINMLSDMSGSGAITASGINTGAIKKSIIWHNLWNLTREPMLLEDKTINEFMIVYSSIIMPLDIMLIGFFSNVLEWSDLADKPFSKDYSMSFTVQEVVPPLETIVQELNGLSFNTEDISQDIANNPGGTGV